MNNIDNVISKEVIYDKNNIIIIKNIHESGDFTYTGKNNNQNALREYMQSDNLQIVKEYIVVGYQP